MPIKKLNFKQKLRLLSAIGGSVIGLLILCLLIAAYPCGYFSSFHQVYRNLDSRDWNDSIEAEARADLEHRLWTYDNVPANASFEWQKVTGDDNSGFNFVFVIDTPSKPPETVVGGWGKDKDGKVIMVTSMDMIN